MKPYFLSLALAAPALVLAQANPVTNIFYGEKGELGQMQVEQADRFHLNGSTEMSWNNRRYRLEESLVLDAAGLPVEITAKGVSAFGAPIEETFRRDGGVSTWQGLKESGESDAEGFYLPADYSTATEIALARALRATGDKPLMLLPQGEARLRAIDSQAVELGERQDTVTLYAIDGLDLMPNYGWYDENMMPFASGEPSWGVLRKGYPLEELKRLSDLQLEAERAHLENMASQLSHSYQSLLIRNVNLVDVEQGQLHEGQDVLLENGKIRLIGKTLKKTGAALEIDGRGKTLIPGLWDMHGHMDSEYGAMYIASGVTSVRDMGSAHDSIMQIEETFDSGKVIGPNLYRSGFFDQLSEYSAGLSVESLEQAHEKIDFFADNGYLQIKLYSSINPEWVPAIAEHAHARGMRLSGHIPAFMNADEAVDAGFDEIQHINMVMLNFLGAKEIDTRQQLRFSRVGEDAHKVDLDSDDVNRFIAKLVRERVVVDPTLATFRSMFLRSQSNVDPEFADVADHFPPQFSRYNFYGAEMGISEEQREDYIKSADALSKLVKKLFDAGVTLVPGTDHAGLGLALQRELIDYAEAGIPAMDVLRIATLDSARVVGMAHKSGSITVGKEADLVLIDGNPLEDLSLLRNAVLVVKGGQYYQPADVFEALSMKPFADRQKVKTL